MKALSFLALIFILFSCSYKNTELPDSGNTYHTENDTDQVPKEVLFAYDKPEDCFNSIVNISNYDIGTTHLLKSYKIGRDILTNSGSMEWILFSKSQVNNQLRSHFISGINSSSSKEIRVYSLYGEELLSTFSFAQKDKTLGTRNFYVVITKTGSEYFNAIFEQVCNGSRDCEILKTDANLYLPDIKSYDEFKRLFPTIYPKFKAHNKPNSLTNEHNKDDSNETAMRYLLHFTGNLSDTAIIRNLSELISGKTISSQSALGYIYTVGEQIKTSFSFTEKVFFRINHRIPNNPVEICFVSAWPWYDYNDDKVKDLQFFPIQGKDTIVSVFGYTDTTGQMNNQCIVAISKTNKSDLYFTDIFAETCGNHCCTMEHVFDSGHSEIYKAIRSKKDFIQKFSK